MMVVQADNYARETEREHIVILGISAEHAHKIAALMNEATRGERCDYYRVEADTYVPWRGMEDLV